ACPSFLSLSPAPPPRRPSSFPPRRSSALPHPHPGARGGSGVLDDVGQGLLDDPVGGQAHLPRDLEGPDLVLEGDRHPEDEVGARSEEHTSELQSRFDLVCRLLLAKKKTGQ